MAQGKQPDRIELNRQLSIKVYDTKNREVVRAECSYAQLKKPSPRTKPSSTRGSDELPNYMKPTSSFGARKDQLLVSLPSTTPALRTRSQANSYQHTTCSSKQKNFTKSSDLSTIKASPKEPSLVKICRYTYCAFHGQKHESVTPFKMLVSKGPSGFRKTALRKGHEEIDTMSTPRIKVANDFLDEIYADAHEERSSVGDDCKIDESYPFKCSADDNRQFAEDVKCLQQMKDEEDKEDNALMRKFRILRIIKKYSYDAALSHDDEEKSIESNNCSHNKNIVSEKFREVDEAEDCGSSAQVQLSDSSQEVVQEHQRTEEADGSKIEAYFYDCLYYSSEDERSSRNKGNIPKDCTEVKDERSTYHTLGSTSTRDSEEMRKFNWRAPRFLQEELGPEAEKVDLRNQMMDERRAVEEWMIDYALQQAVKRLAPARKTKVQLLVEAFETVMPLPTCETHLQYTGTGFARSRTVQACS